MVQAAPVLQPLVPFPLKEWVPLLLADNLQVCLYRIPPVFTLLLHLQDMLCPQTLTLPLITGGLYGSNTDVKYD